MSPADSLDDEELVAAMVGETVEVVRNTGSRRHDRAPAVLELRGVRLAGAGEGAGLRETDLTLYAGEVLGVAGVSGNGQRELADLLAGAARPDAGQISRWARPRSSRPTRRPSMPPASSACRPIRCASSSCPGLSIAEHAALWERAKTGGRFDTPAAGRKLTETGQRLALKLADSSRQLDQLSGGNIQRVLLALALGETASVLVVSYPTRGLDVLTTETTRLLLLKARDAGAAVVLISEDLDEVLRLSDRIAVLAHGHVSAIVPAADADRQSLGHLMTAHAPTTQHDRRPRGADRGPAAGAERRRRGGSFGGSSRYVAVIVGGYVVSLAIFSMLVVAQGRRAVQRLSHDGRLDAAQLATRCSRRSCARSRSRWPRSRSPCRPGPG